VFIDDPDHVTFPTGGIEPAESTQLPGPLPSHKHNSEHNSAFFLLRAGRNEMNGTNSTKNTKRKTSLIYNIKHETVFKKYVVCNCYQ